MTTTPERRARRAATRRLGAGGMQGKGGRTKPFLAWRGKVIEQREMYAYLRKHA